MKHRLPAVLFALSALGALSLLWMIRQSFYGTHETLAVRIEKGANAQRIAQALHKENVIASPAAFLMLTKITGKSNAFHYGPYLFEKNRYWNIVRKLAKGETHKIKVVIPEGWTAWQIAERLKREGVIDDPETFLRQVKNEKLEGRLFPETYFFEPLIGSTEAAGLMKNQFDRLFSPEMGLRAKEIKMSLQQLLTMASIIEREARVDEERALVSSVYHNRLKKRMFLEADPTVQYALSGGRAWKDRLTYKDLKFSSPYNTYRRMGLPPGPICNPGLKSIQAALFPAATPFLFFVADGTGRHQFFTTHKDHIRWQVETRKKRRNH